MSLPSIHVVPSKAALARLNPTTKLIIAAVITVVLVVSADAVTAGVILTLELLALPWAGVAWGWLRPRLLALGLLGVSVLILNTAVSDRGGGVLVSLVGIEIRDEALLAGCAAALRIMAMALPGVVLLATTDPTDLADALAQRWRMPERFVIGALVALRLVGVLGLEWQLMSRARQARGLPGGTLRSFPGQLFGLLVAALRRSVRLAQAVEARGLGVVAERTWWRASDLTRSDYLARVAVVAAMVAAVGISVLLGTWRPIGS